MSTLLQISDPHFGTEQRPVEAALRELAHQLQPELIVLSGDITQRARQIQFVAARNFVDSLPKAQLLAIPGNHDIPLFNLAARIFAPYRNYQRAFGEELEPTHASAHLLVIGVNTTRPHRHKDGEVSAQQIARVAAKLQGATQRQLRVVVVHQPVHVIRPEDLTNLLHGHAAAIEAWADAGADLILGGHIHLPYVRALREQFPELSREVWAVQAGTAVSTRVRHEAPNSVNVVRHDAAQRTCEVERWDYAATHSEFRCVDMNTIALARQAAKLPERRTGQNSQNS